MTYAVVYYNNDYNFNLFSVMANLWHTIMVSLNIEPRKGYLHLDNLIEMDQCDNEKCFLIGW